MQKVRKQYAYVMFRLAISLIPYFLLFSINQKIFVCSGIQKLDTQNPETPENWNFSFKLSDDLNTGFQTPFQYQAHIQMPFENWTRWSGFWTPIKVWQQNRLVPFEYLSCMVSRSILYCLKSNWN